MSEGAPTIALRNELMSKIPAIVLAVVVFLYFFRLGTPAVWNPNEAFYAETPREMIESGDFLTPRFNYEFRFQKPPLLYWLVAASYSLLGISEFAVRLAPALLAVGCLALTFLISRGIFGSIRAGLMSALVLSTAFDFNSAARYASPEILLLFAITLTLFLFHKWYDGGRYERKWLVMFYISAGLATLTKGPVGILIPSMIACSIFLIDRNPKALRRFLDPLGIVLYVFVAGWWYGLVFYEHRNAFGSMLFDENLRRFFTKKTGASNPLFYFTVLPWSFFPGSFLLIPAVIGLWGRLKAKSPLRFVAVWAAAIFVFFSISGSKLPPYIMPMYPALSVIIGGYLAEGAESRRHRTSVLILAALGLLVIAAGIYYLRTFIPSIGLHWIVLTLSPAILLLFVKDGSVSRPVALFAGMAVFYAVFLTMVLPHVEGFRRYKEISHAVKKIDPDGVNTFYAIEGYQQNLSFYLGRKVHRSEDRDIIMKKLSARYGDFLLMRASTLDAMTPVSGSRPEILWRGPYYDKSESRFFRFLTDIRERKVDDFVVVR